MAYGGFDAFYESRYGGGIHQQIITAVECVNSNRCQKLDQKVQEIKSSIDKIHTKDSWDDDAGNTFRNCATTCSNILNNVSASINSLFVQSENLYQLALVQLNALQTLDKNYNDHCNNKPAEDSKEFSDWDNKRKQMETLYNEMGSNIDTYLNNLDQINGCTLNENGNINGGLNLSDMDIPNLVFPPLFEFDMDKDYLFDGGDGYIYVGMDGVNLDQLEGLIGSIGTQDSNQCAEYSRAYMAGIMENTGRIPSFYNSYSTDDSQKFYQMVANEILQGRPVMIMTGVKQNDGTISRHFVLAVGIKKGANVNNFQATDFKIADPMYADITNFGDDNSNRVRFPTKAEETTVGGEIWNNSRGYYLVTFNSPIDYTQDDGINKGYYGASGEVYMTDGSLTKLDPSSTDHYEKYVYRSKNDYEVEKNNA